MSAGRRIAFDDLVACPSCDALHHKVELECGEVACCSRCSVVLQTRKWQAIDRPLAAAITVFVLFVLALCLPFLGLSRAGIESQISILDATLQLLRDDFTWLGLTGLAFLVCLPLARCLLLFMPLLSIRMGRASSAIQRLSFRWALRLGPWAMADIFLVGAAISLVKIGSVARLEVGFAFWILLAAVAVSAYLDHALCKDTAWEALAIR